ncbi:MAG: RimK family alpha-L-glutamate ligase [Acidimicrobiales bacterium]
MKGGGAPRIAIVTRHDDFHAYVVQGALASRGAACAIVAVDHLPSDGAMSWSSSGEVARPVVHDVDGGEVAVADLDLVWWRRLTGEPRIPDWVRDEAARDLVVGDCRATVLGIFLTAFRGRWVSHPEATRVAQNKLVQLDAAVRAGLRVPRTLVSQDPATVRRFCADLEWEVVVKTVGGSQKTPLMTGRVTPELLADDRPVAVSPAIYQELVPGTRHLRISCFGPAVHTAMLETELLDWRYPMDAEVQPWDLDAGTAGRLLAVIDDLGLRMGVADMKLGPDGEPVWLEVNPQGQFLFVEGMCGMPLTEAFVDFLLAEAAMAPAAAASQAAWRL